MSNLRLLLCVNTLFLSFFSMLAPASDFSASSVTCASPSGTAFAGGYQVTRSCSVGTVGGVGSTLAIASNNAQNFADLSIVPGAERWVVQQSGVNILAGGYKIYFTAGGGKRISGVGSTATDTGVNALGFAALGAATGHLYAASTYADGVVAMAGGYRAEFYRGSTFVSGVGTTLTAAGVNGLGFAELASATNRRYQLHPSDSQAFVGGYLLTFYRSAGAGVSGVGSTMTDAARTALGFAELAETGGRRCLLAMSSIEMISGGFRVTYSCGSRSVVGSGSTVTAAGEDALSKARAL